MGTILWIIFFVWIRQQNWQKKIKTAPFNRYDAEVIYRERWLPSIRYYLPITQFSEKQCKSIQQPGYNAVLPKMGFNQQLPRALIFWLLKYQGKHLSIYGIYQYTGHLVCFVGYLRQNTELSSFMRIQIDQHQQLIGSHHHFLMLNSIDYPYVGDSIYSFCGNITLDRVLYCRYRGDGNNPWLEKTMCFSWIRYVKGLDAVTD